MPLHKLIISILALWLFNLPAQDSVPASKNSINITGYFEGTAGHGFGTGPNKLLFGQGFTNQNDTPTLNQFNLTAERLAELKPSWDFGFRVDTITGYDAGSIHGNGLFDNHHGAGKPAIQFDLFQLYSDLTIPVGDGMRVRAGKFATPHGFESTRADSNALVSHSYLFNFATPFTHTGLRLTQQIGEQWQLDCAVVRGWEHAVEDNNSSPSVFAGASWTPSADHSASVYIITGPEKLDNNRDNLTLIDFIYKYNASESVRFGVNADVAQEDDAKRGSPSNWYGAAAYCSVDTGASNSINSRIEYFRDERGARTGVAGDFFEATVGFTYKPFLSEAFGVALRPEIRYDASSERVFQENSSRHQFSVLIELLITF